MEQSYEEENLQVQRYIDNEMTVTERIEFEKDLEQNPALREALAFEQDLLQLGRSAADKIEKYYESAEANTEKGQDMLAMIMRASKNWDEQQAYAKAGPKVPPLLPEATKRDAPVRKMEHWTNWAVAAAVICILLSSVAIVIFREPATPTVVKEDKDKKDNIFLPDTSGQKKNPPPENLVKQQDEKNKPGDKLPFHRVSKVKQGQLFAENFTPDTAPERLEGPIASALTDYANGNYKEAVEGMDTKTRGVDRNEKLTDFYRRYYKAMSFLADNNAGKAIPEFEAAIKKSPDPLSKTKSQWYLALSNLKTGNLETADSLLNQLALKGTGEFKKRAGALKKSLE